MKKVLIAICCVLIATGAFAQRMASAKSIVNAASKKATAENKKILVIFHASWCGWCHKMDSSLADPACKSFFDKNYVITHITVHETDDKKAFENPGADELLKSYKAYEAGLPFWVVLDKNGALLFDSFIKDEDGKASNIGCPANQEEVDAFVEIIKATSSAKESQLRAVHAVFRKNEQQ